MEPQQKITKLYSLAFKQKVISELESGKLTRTQARKLYGISGGSTLNTWLKKLGKSYLLNKVVRVELKDEVSRLKQLEKEKKELESALANAHLKLITYETLIEVAEEELGVDIKKNLKSERLSSVIKGAKKFSRKRN